MPSDRTLGGASRPAEQPRQIGSYTIRTIVDARFALDGGSMFGVVPKPLWSRSNPPDDRNRIQLVSRLLYLEGDGRRILVDTGLGNRWDGRPRDIYDIRPQAGGVLESLRRLGTAPDQITDVVLTHLHFDHAAGTTCESAGRLRLAFPAARHHLQKRHWEWAARPSLKDAASFRREDFDLLAADDLLVLHDGDGEILPGIDVVVLNGHTAAMQAVLVHDSADRVFFPADLVPTTSHLRWPYIMGYDNQPLVTLAEKQRLLPRAAEEDWLVVFQHDPAVAAARLRVGAHGGIEIDEVVAI